MADIAQVRLQRSLRLSPAHEELYSGIETGEKLRDIFNRYHLREELYTEYALAFGDVVLEIEREEHLPALLTQRLKLPEKLASLIGHDLLELLNAALSSKKEAPVKPQEVIEEPKIPDAPPAWSRTFAQPSPPHAEPPTGCVVPNYQRPLTDLPRYVKDDPYRERPR